MELVNRDELEADFAKRFGKIARRHMKEFRELLGEPPELDKVPQEFWDRMQRESDDTLWPILLLIFGTSAEQHGWTGEAMGLAAYAWAVERAEKLAEKWTDSTRGRLENGWGKLTKPTETRGRRTIQNQERTVEEAEDFNRSSGAASVVEVAPNKDEIDELIDIAFGPKRVARTVGDETTRARHAGGEAGVEETVGCTQDDVWQKNPSLSASGPCEVCTMLDGLKRSEWPWRYQEGPPSPHDGCVCTVRHARKLLSEAIGDMLDDPDFKSLSVRKTSFIREWAAENGINLEAPRFKAGHDVSQENRDHGRFAVTAGSGSATKPKPASTAIPTNQMGQTSPIDEDRIRNARRTVFSQDQSAAQHATPEDFPENESLQQAHTAGQSQLAHSMAVRLAEHDYCLRQAEEASRNGRMDNAAAWNHEGARRLESANAIGETARLRREASREDVNRRRQQGEEAQRNVHRFADVPMVASALEAGQTAHAEALAGYLAERQAAGGDMSIRSFEIENVARQAQLERNKILRDADYKRHADRIIATDMKLVDDFEKAAKQSEDDGNHQRAESFRETAAINRAHAERVQRDIDQGNYVPNHAYKPAQMHKPVGSHAIPQPFPRQVEALPETRQRIKELFGAEWTPEHVAALVGAPEESTTLVVTANAGHKLTIGFEIAAENPENDPVISARRTISVESSGELTCHNDIVTVAKKYRGGGIGSSVLAAQIENMRNAGFVAIDCLAARGDGYIGYKVWPKVGYDADLEHEQIEKLQRSRVPDSVKRSTTVLELYASPAGIKWWEKNGDSTDMAINLQDRDTMSYRKSVDTVKKAKSKGKPIIKSWTEQQRSEREADFNAEDNIFSMEMLESLDEITAEGFANDDLKRILESSRSLMKSFDPNEARGENGRWVSDGSTHQSTNNDKYVLRRTIDPLGDLQRGWSAWGGQYTKSPLDNPGVENAMQNAGKDEYDIINDLPEDFVHETDEGWEINDSPEAMEGVADWIRDNLDLDIQKDPKSGKYALRHHEGLSSYDLNSSNPDEALEKGRQRLMNGRDDYLTGGETGIRPVAYHHIGDDKYVFRVHDVGSQMDS